MQARSEILPFTIEKYNQSLANLFEQFFTKLRASNQDVLENESRRDGNLTAEIAVAMHERNMIKLIADERLVSDFMRDLTAVVENRISLNRESDAELLSLESAFSAALEKKCHECTHSDKANLKKWVSDQLSRETFDFQESLVDLFPIVAFAGEKFYQIRELQLAYARPDSLLMGQSKQLENNANYLKHYNIRSIEQSLNTIIESFFSAFLTELQSKMHALGSGDLPKQQQSINAIKAEMKKRMITIIDGVINTLYTDLSSYLKTSDFVLDVKARVTISTHVYMTLLDSRMDSVFEEINLFKKDDFIFKTVKAHLIKEGFNKLSTYIITLLNMNHPQRLHLLEVKTLLQDMTKQFKEKHGINTKKLEEALLNYRLVNFNTPFSRETLRTIVSLSQLDQLPMKRQISKRVLKPATQQNLGRVAADAPLINAASAVVAEKTANDELHDILSISMKVYKRISFLLHKKSLDQNDLFLARQEDQEISRFYKDIHDHVRALMNQLFTDESVVSKFVAYFATSHAEQKQTVINLALSKFKQTIKANITSWMNGDVDSVPEPFRFVRTFVDGSTINAINNFINRQGDERIQGLSPINARLLSGEYERIRRGYIESKELKNLKLANLELFIDQLFDCLSSYLKLETKELFGDTDVERYAVNQVASKLQQFIASRSTLFLGEFNKAIQDGAIRTLFSFAQYTGDDTDSIKKSIKELQPAYLQDANAMISLWDHLFLKELPAVINEFMPSDLHDKNMNEVLASAPKYSVIMQALVADATDVFAKEIFYRMISIKLDYLTNESMSPEDFLKAWGLIKIIYAETKNKSLIEHWAFSAALFLVTTEPASFDIGTKVSYDLLKDTLNNARDTPEYDSMIKSGEKSACSLSEDVSAAITALLRPAIPPMSVQNRTMGIAAAVVQRPIFDPSVSSSGLRFMNAQHEYNGIDLVRTAGIMAGGVQQSNFVTPTATPTNLRLFNAQPESDGVERRLFGNRSPDTDTLEATQSGVGGFWG